MPHAMQHCQRPWWKRPPVWVIAVVAVVLVGMAVAEQAENRAPLPYSTFLDQLDAGNVASVTIQGTEITVRLKRPLDTSSGAATPDVRSRLPDFGDPTLIAALRAQHVVIEVAAPSAWAWLLGRVPWPMLIVLGVMLVAFVLRLVRGGKAPPGSPAPMHGMMGLIAGFFVKERQAASPPADDSSDPKGHRPSAE